MRLKSTLLIATATVFGTASFAVAQTAQYDYTESGYLSYGPKVGAPQTQHRQKAKILPNGPTEKYDYTETGYLSYGAK